MGKEIKLGDSESTNGYSEQKNKGGKKRNGEIKEKGELT